MPPKLDDTDTTYIGGSVGVKGSNFVILKLNRFVFNLSLDLHVPLPHVTIRKVVSLASLANL